MRKIKDFVLPYNFTPRDYQLPVMSSLDSGKKRHILVAHRRFGKDTCVLNFCIKEAMLNPGIIYHCFPTYKQGRKILWDGRGTDGIRFIEKFIPPEIIKKKKKTHLCINEQEMKIELTSGSLFQIIGVDEFDSVMGTNPRYVVFSEYALMNPYVWDYFLPILEENGGTAIFPFTPRGENHAYNLFKYALSDPEHWTVNQKSIYDTKALSIDTIEKIKREYIDRYGNDALFRQEYCVDFKVPIAGSYYAEQINTANDEKRIRSIKYEPSLKVNTAWDLGLSDYMTVWYYQFVGTEVHFIDYDEYQGKSLSAVISEVKKKPYVYGRHIAPHDIRVRELTSGKSRLDTARELGIEFDICPNLPIADGIDCVRNIFAKCWFDGQKCQKGLNALKSYHKKYDETKRTYLNEPYHDWASHACDSFRMFAVDTKNEDIHSVCVPHSDVYVAKKQSPWSNPYNFNGKNC